MTRGDNMDRLRKGADLLLANTLIYKCCLILIAFFYVLPFTAEVTQKIIKVMLVWGGGIVVYHFVKRKTEFWKNGYGFFLVFLAFNVISILVNFRLNLAGNLIYLLYFLVAGAIPLLVDKKKGQGQIFFELRIVSAIIILITVVVSVLSFLIYVTGYQGSVTANGTEYILGFVEGRLYGVMGNPNTAALMSFISIVCSLLEVKLLVRRKLCVLCYFNMVIQFVVFSLANSRSALVCLGVGVAGYIFFKLEKVKNSRVFIKIILACGAFLIGIGITYVTSQVSNRIMAVLPSIYDFAVFSVTDSTHEEKGTIVSDSESLIEEQPTTIFPERSISDNSELQQKPEFSIADTNRNYDSATDISNGRVTIWIAGFKVAKDNILFGVGYENILENANEQLPIEFVERSPGLAANMHNVYMQILVGTGLPALISFLAFLGKTLFDAIKYRHQSTRVTVKQVVSILTCCIVGILVENLFDSNIMGFMCFFIVPVFWTLYGYLIKLTYPNNKSPIEVYKGDKETHEEGIVSD